jgi:hypothetical protein
MADVLLGTLVVVGLLVTLPSLWLLLRALFPDAVERSRARIVRRPVLCFVAGVIPALLLIAGGLVLLNKAPGGWKALGFPPLLLGFLLAGIGLAGLSTAVGERLPSGADEGRAWRSLLRGAACLELSFLIPFLGWFGLLPLAAVAAVGAATMALVSGEGPVAPAAAPAPSPAA